MPVLFLILLPLYIVLVAVAKVFQMLFSDQAKGHFAEVYQVVNIIKNN